MRKPAIILSVCFLSILVVAVSAVLGLPGLEPLVRVSSPSLNLTPIIGVYSPGLPGFGEMLVSLIREDERIDAEVMILRTQEDVVQVTALPTTACIVIYSDNMRQIDRLQGALTTFFDSGGGLVGITEICYVPSAKGLAETVFPTFANASKKKTSPREKRVRTYVREEEAGLEEGLPERFGLVSMGTYYSGDEEGNYLRVPGDYSVAYRDEETGSPLVLIHEGRGGGRSVAMPGIWVVKAERVDIYYGNLVSDENFVKLFTNMVLWAGGAPRYEDLSGHLEERLQGMKEGEERLREEVEREQKRKSTHRIMILGIVWVVGLAACGIITKKIILTPITPEQGPKTPETPPLSNQSKE